MMNTVRKWVKRQSVPPMEEVVGDQSGVRPRPEQDVIQEGTIIYVSDYETIPLRFVNESDMMLWMARRDPFLSHKDYVTEVQDYMVSHFLSVFTFHPQTGKVTEHTR